MGTSRTNLPDLEIACERIDRTRREGGNALHLGALFLERLPNEIRDLPTVEALYCDYNRIDSLDDIFSHLPSLKLLVADHNQLKTIPEDLFLARSRRGLALHENRISSLSPSVGNLGELETLTLDKNTLPYLPDTIGNLVNLKGLSIDNNCLGSLPESIGALTNLEHLSIEHNRLIDLPNSIAHLNHLVSIRVEGNPLNPELSAAARQGTKALKAYLAARDKAKVTLNEGKLILVGEGEVGKSCLLGALRDDPWRERTSTHGIEVFPVEVISPQGVRIQLNGWDFGGQQVYRPTHQLFFTAPAIYLVVWKPREGYQQGMVREWIRLVLHREPTAKILVVASHGGPDERLPDIAPQEFRDEFGAQTICGFHHIDSKPDANGHRIGIAELKKELGRIAAGIPEVNRAIPSKWASARNALRERRDAYVQHEAFAQECRHIHKMDDEETALFTRIAHELGDIVHYHTDPALKNIVILKPNWLAKAISFVLADPVTRERQGLADHEHLFQLWSTPPLKGEEGYPTELHPLFLKLMQKFDLLYPVILDGPDRTRSNTSLIAQFVNDGRPDVFPDWGAQPVDGETEQRQICRLADDRKGQTAAAEGLFYQLIVRLHRFSLGRDNYCNSVHWKRGLMLDDAYNGRALLEHMGNDIRITVRAVYPAQLLGYLTLEVKTLVESFWKGIRCEVTVPCINPCGIDDPGRALFEVKKLIVFRKKGMIDFPCFMSGCNQAQNIDALLRNAPISSKNNVLDDLKEVLSALSTIRSLQKEFANETGRWLQQLNEGQKEILSRIDERYSALMKSLLDEAKDGPRLFSINIIDDIKLWNPLSWLRKEFQVTLWCEHSRLPLHKVAEESGRGVYRLILPRSWLAKAAPFLKVIHTTLRLVLPAALPFAKLQVDDQTYKFVEDELEAGKALAESMLDAGEKLSEATKADSLATSIDNPANHGSVLRELHAFLKFQDPGFAGLMRVQKGHEFLWIHPKFSNQY